LTLRVDAGRFEDALGALRRLGEIERESVAAQDITKAYTDLETRLRVKREAEGRLRDLLRTRAGELEEILAAERELARITEEIELLEGERRFYDHQVALSTITLGLHEPEALVEPSSFAPLAAALSNSLRLLALSLAALFSFAVAAAPWLLVLWLLWRVVRRLRRGRGEEPGPKE
jgi:hypothetical protein